MVQTKQFLSLSKCIDFCVFVWWLMSSLDLSWSVGEADHSYNKCVWGGGVHPLYTNDWSHGSH